MTDLQDVPVAAGTRLAVRYSFHPAETAGENRKVVAMHHGILHCQAHFLKLIAALNAVGVHVLMIDQQSEKSRWKNCIGLGSYARGMAAAIGQFEQEHPGYQVTTYVCHSMGAAIGEQMQERYPALCRPTVLLAPIPVQGAVGIFVRLLLTRPWALLRAIATLSVLSLVRGTEEVRQIFFDEKTGTSTVEGCRRNLKHSPFGAYLQLTLRYVLRLPFPQKHNGQPNLLLTSPTDYIFRKNDQVNEYRETEFFYRRGYLRTDGTPWLEVAEIPGGHDFFIGQGERVAQQIAQFLQQQDYFPPIEIPSPEIPPGQPVADALDNGDLVPDHQVTHRIDQPHPLPHPSPARRLHPLALRAMRRGNLKPGWPVRQHGHGRKRI